MLSKILDDLKSATEDDFAKNDEGTQFCKAVCSNILRFLQQCINSRGSQFENETDINWQVNNEIN